jgi:hypothetical protein
VKCCEDLKIDSPELEKPAGLLCKNCTTSGCAIYESRPDVCRTWYCLWRLSDKLSEELRPDLAKIVISYETMKMPRTPFEQAFIVIRTTENTATFDTPAVAAAIEQLIEVGTLPIWLSHAGKKSLIYPRPQIAAVVQSPYGQHSLEARAEAKEWMTQYQQAFPAVTLKRSIIAMLSS